MQTLKIPDKYKNILAQITESLKSAYNQELVSIILYGSAASGEFIDNRSNLDLLVILKDTDPDRLSSSAAIFQKHKIINCLFFTEDYIARSSDIFPIEFLDMKDNYLVLYGKDVLKEISIDPRNLRFQCEQELKSKLIKLRQAYLLLGKDTLALRSLLLTSFTSVMHILRNALRIKGSTPPYPKEDVLKALEQEFKIRLDTWSKILQLKNKGNRLSAEETRSLFADFIRELESAANLVDKL